MSAKKALYEMKSECNKDDFCMQFTCFGEKSGNVTRFTPQYETNVNATKEVKTFMCFKDEVRSTDETVMALMFYITVLWCKLWGLRLIFFSP